MRNWNFFLLLCIDQLTSVFTVPMRNWNRETIKRLRRLINGFYSTYEELKRSILLNFIFTIDSFLQYLWGIETSVSYRCRYSFLNVFTVPMRNWNFDWLSFTIKKNIVFTVPMRNWNIAGAEKLKLTMGFLQYLWGIETLGFATLPKTWEVHVFTVPMRNWNEANTLQNL